MSHLLFVVLFCLFVRSFIYLGQMILLVVFFFIDAADSVHSDYCSAFPQELVHSVVVQSKEQRS
jgi:hypothetical protein